MATQMLTAINEGFFADCGRIREMVIPETVKTVYRNGFSSCYGIMEYYFYPKTPPDCSGGGVFSGMNNRCILYVPKGCLEIYSADATLKAHASKMREMDE